MTQQDGENLEASAAQRAVIQVALNLTNAAVLHFW